MRDCPVCRPSPTWPARRFRASRLERIRRWFLATHFNRRHRDVHAEDLP